MYYSYQTIGLGTLHVCVYVRKERVEYLIKKCGSSFVLNVYVREEEWKIEKRRRCHLYATEKKMWSVINNGCGKGVEW